MCWLHVYLYSSSNILAIASEILWNLNFKSSYGRSFSLCLQYKSYYRLYKYSSSNLARISQNKSWTFKFQIWSVVLTTLQESLVEYWLNIIYSIDITAENCSNQSPIGPWSTSSRALVNPFQCVTINNCLEKFRIWWESPKAFRERCEDF